MNDPRAHFDQLYRGDPDPWQVGSSWYECRKRQLLLASLPQKRYERGLEAGCGNGHATVALAARCNALHAADFSATAIEHARRQLRHHRISNATLHLMHLPWQWPALSFDLIVVAETAYYLDDAGVAGLLQRCRHSLRRGGHLLFCHWYGQFDDRRQDTDALHQQVTEQHWLTPVLRHEEAFRIDVWQRKDSRQ